MNDRVEQFARGALKDGLAELTVENQNMFRRMYGKQLPDGKGVDFEVPIDTVVDEMPSAKLDWAMEQVENTLANARARAIEQGTK